MIMHNKIKIDQAGRYIEQVHPNESGQDIIDTPCTESFYHPKWNGESWEESATQEYIDSLKAQAEPQEPTETELLQAELADLKARLAKVEAVPIVKTALEPVIKNPILSK